MFRTSVIYLWLFMVGACGGLVFLLALAGALGSVLLGHDDVTTVILALLLPFPLVLGACFIAIFGSLPMLMLMQRLLISAGSRSGRPAEFRTFRRHLTWYSLIPATLPALSELVPRLRELGWPLLGLLGTWAVATVVVWHLLARRLHAEWQAGVA